MACLAVRTRVFSSIFLSADILPQPYHLLYEWLRWEYDERSSIRETVERLLRHARREQAWSLQRHPGQYQM